MYSKKPPLKRKLTFWDTQPKSSKKPKVSSSPVLTAFKQTASTSVKTVNLESYKREIEHLDPALLQTSQYDLYLVSKLGLYATHSLAAALNHVPKSWPKRQETITNIVTAALEIDKHPIPDNLRGLVSVVLSKGATLMTNAVLDESIKASCARKHGQPYHFLAPSVDSCVNPACGDGTLYAPTAQLVNCTMFTLKGAQAVQRCTLICRSCGNRYGLNRLVNIFDTIIS